MNSILSQIEQIGIVPIITIDEPAKAPAVAKAILAGGIPCGEVTLRTESALEAIAQIARQVPGLLLGVGTVLHPQQVDAAVDAGAKYIITPGLNPHVVRRCQQRGVPVLPGCATPSDMEQALGLGLKAVKLFPAQQLGGPAYLKAVGGPYRALKFMPSGGVSADNLTDYLALPNVLACGGSWMVKPALIKEERYGEITALCRQAMLSMLDFHLAHVGLNTENAEAAMGAARRFESLFGFAAKEGGSSVFAADCVEVMKAPYLGKNGHIAVGTSSVARARAYLQAMGCAFREESAKRNAAGETVAVYLADEVAGFAVHLVRHVKQ